MSGFSLVEVHVALLIFSVGITATLQTSWWTFQSSMQQHSALLAVKGVQEYYMEYLRSLTFDNLVVTAGNAAFTGAPPLDSSAPYASVDKLPGGSGIFSIQPEAGGNRKRITITVSWTDPRGRTSTSTVSTVVTRDGLTN